MTITQTGVNFGQVVTWIDLREPLPARQFAVFEAALVEHEALIFPERQICSGPLTGFARRFGQPSVHPFAPRDGESLRLIRFLNDDATASSGTDVRHTDETVRAEPSTAIPCAEDVPLYPIYLPRPDPVGRAHRARH